MPTQAGHHCEEHVYFLHVEFLNCGAILEIYWRCVCCTTIRLFRKTAKDHTQHPANLSLRAWRGFIGGRVSTVDQHPVQRNLRPAGGAISFTFLVGSFVVMVSTSLAAGYLLNSFCREAAGSGIPQAKVAFWKDFGVIPWRAAWVKFLAGVLSIGGGGSWAGKVPACMSPPDWRRNWRV